MVDTILHGDALTLLRTLPDGYVQSVVTSPPYWSQRDYGVAGQLGLEATPTAYVQCMVEVFAEVRRVMRPDGTLWLNIGDTYNQDSPIRSSATERMGAHPVKLRRSYKAGGCKRKDLIGVHWMLATALRSDGWYVRSEIIWAKPAVRPEGRLSDRPDRSHESIFLLTRIPKGYHVDRERLASWGTVWKGAIHAGKTNGAAGSIEIAERCVLAGSRIGDIVLDPFVGSGTVGVVARRYRRHYLGIELNETTAKLAEERIAGEIQPVLWTA